MHSQYPYKFDVSEIILHFGGVNRVYEALDALGVAINKKSIQKWRERDFIPADALAALVVAAKAKKKPLRLEETVRERKT